MCLMGRTLPCDKKLKEYQECKPNDSKVINSVSTTECPQSRVDFYQTLSLLIRMGVGKEEKPTRRGVSV